MLIIKDNDLGQIRVMKSCLAQLITECFKLYDDRIWLCNKKGKIVVGANHQVSFDVEEVNGALDIKIYTIIKFGTSISETTDSILNHLVNKINNTLGEQKFRIIINILGIKSKQIAKRDIEIVSKNEFI